jgi:hypothetical protein
MIMKTTILLLLTQITITFVSISFATEIDACQNTGSTGCTAQDTLREGCTEPDENGIIICTFSEEQKAALEKIREILKKIDTQKLQVWIVQGVH